MRQSASRRALSGVALAVLLCFSPSAHLWAADNRQPIRIPAVVSANTEKSATTVAATLTALVPYRPSKTASEAVILKRPSLPRSASPTAALVSASEAVLLSSHDGRLVGVLRVATQTSFFEFTISEAGCLSISGSVRGRREMERIWGPEWLASGSHQVRLPTGRLSGRKGLIELFTVSLKPADVIGRAGKGERQFIHPMGISWDDTTRHLYVADTGNDRIVKLSADGRYVTQYGGFGVAFGDDKEEREESLDEPWDVAVGGFSNLYVSDQNNNRICEFDAYRSYKGTFFPKGNDLRKRLSKPRGCIIDSENHLWIVDGMQDRVLKLSGTGEIMLELGGYGWSKQRFKNPTQIAVDTDGRIFVCDRGNSRLQVFDRLGGFICEIRDHLKSPVGVAVDPDGLVWVCDEVTDELGIYTPAGRRLSFAGSDGAGVKLRSPADVVALKDRAYLLDSGNHRLIVFDRLRNVSSIAWQGPSAVVK